MLLNKSQDIFQPEERNFEDNEVIMDNIIERLPAEAATLMGSIVKQFNKSSATKSNYEDPVINKLVTTLPSDALILLKNIINYYRKEPIKINPHEEVNKAIRSQPLVLQRAIKQKRALELIKYAKSETERLTIYEAGVALGLIVGTSGREDVIEIMKEHSKIIYESTSTEAIYFYHDISVSVFFDDKDIVNEVQFGNGFKGETSRGLKVGDNINKAIELYGKPRMKSSKAALWSYFSIFCVNNRIRCIRIQS